MCSQNVSIRPRLERSWKRGRFVTRQESANKEACGAGGGGCSLLERVPSSDPLGELDVAWTIIAFMCNITITIVGIIHGAAIY
jgi:hypothetical protein